MDKLPEVLENKIYKMAHEMSFCNVINELNILVYNLRKRFTSSERIGDKYLDKFDIKYRKNLYMNWYPHLLKEKQVNNIYIGRCESCSGILLFCNCYECSGCFNMCKKLVYNSRIGNVCEGCDDEDHRMIDNELYNETYLWPNMFNLY
tara:strand:- start:1224 stop:1667 length:444 start_codon:yes stop_codon:yes gene_type:complete